MAEAFGRGDRWREAPQSLERAGRVISTLGGAALVIHALRRPSLPNALLALGGAALLRRGISGRGAPRERRPEDTHGTGRRGERTPFDEVEAASEDSFPASDPPAWNPMVAGHPARS